LAYNPFDPGIATNAGICGDPRVTPEDDGATNRTGGRVEINGIWYYTGYWRNEDAGVLQATEVQPNKLQ
jgi:hypothetical protein